LFIYGIFRDYRRSGYLINHVQRLNTKKVFKGRHNLYKYIEDLNKAKGFLAYAMEAFGE